MPNAQPIRFAARDKRLTYRWRTNRLSLFHLMDGLAAQAFPIVLPTLMFLAWLERSAKEAATGDMTLRLKLRGREIANLPLGYDFQDKLRTRIITEIGGVVVDSPGRIEASIIFKNRSIADWDMPIDAIVASTASSAEKSRTSTAKAPTGTKAQASKQIAD
jgi:hypothetical protein